MSSPVSKTHPAEVMFAVKALHVIAAAVLLDTDIALGAVLRVRRDVVRCLAVVRALRQPSPGKYLVKIFRFNVETENIFVRINWIV